jgi:hypothetical protein
VRCSATSEEFAQKYAAVQAASRSMVSIPKFNKSDPDAFAQRA